MFTFTHTLGQASSFFGNSCGRALPAASRPNLSHKIGGLFLPRRRPAQPAVTRVCADLAPRACEPSQAAEKGALRRAPFWAGRLRKSPPPLNPSVRRKNSPASTPLATITGAVSRPATTTGANGSLSPTDARWAPTSRSASPRSASATTSTQAMPAAASDTERAARPQQALRASTGRGESAPSA
jgi:hypothetical protein